MESSILRICDSYDDFFNLGHLEGAIVIICPSPVVADSVSERLSNPQISTITISQFSREILKKILSKEYDELFKRKSDLNLMLASAWKQQFGQEKSFSLYKQAFNLYTELRSYTLDELVLSHIVELYPEDIRSAIDWFDKLLRALNICDEHEGYSLIKENARMPEQECVTPKEQNIIFWGFPYYSGIQVDMIKSLGIRNHIEIPVTKYVYGQSIKTDWVQWFDTETIPEKCKLDPIECEIIEIGKNRLAASLQSFWDSKEKDVLLVEKQMSISQALEVSIPKLSFKIPVELLSQNVVRIFDELKQEFEVCVQESREFLTEELLSFLSEKLKKEIAKSNADWKMLQSLALVQDVVTNWFDLASVNERITLFDLDVLKESSLLNTTRNFQYNMVRKPNGRLVGLESIDALDLNRDIYICATQKYNRLNTTGTPFVKGVNEILQDVAPLRRYRFEFEVFKEKISRLLRDPSRTLFIEKELEKIDRGWAEILADHSGRKRVLKFESDIVEDKDFLFLDKRKKVEIKQISASRLQSYIECPTKYYYQKNEPLETFYSDRSKLSPADLGQIEHEVVELFFKSKASLDKLVDKAFQKYMEKEEIALDDVLYLSYRQEIKMYSLNGIKILERFKEIDPSINFVFEQSHKIQKHGVTIFTRPDCIVQGKLFRGVLDFKRSSASIASANELLAKDKIQLPFYAQYYLEEISSINLMGYICLANPEESKFWSPEKELAVQAFSCCDKKLYRPKSYVIEEWEQFFEEFDTFIGEKIHSLLTDESFVVHPKNSDVCLYCPVNHLCSHKAKGEA